MISDSVSLGLAAMIGAAAALRFVPSQERAGTPLDACEVAYLRGGPRAAAQTSLVELHELGSVSSDSGRLIRTNAVPRGSSPLAHALYGSLYGRSHPLRLQTKPKVQEALAEVSRHLQQSGLLLPARRWVFLRMILVAVPVVGMVQLMGSATVGHAVAVGLSVLAAVGLWLLPRRTRRGSLELRRQRASAAQQPESAVMAVALSGAPALRALVPGFTEDAGLLSKPSPEWFGDAKIESRAASSGGNRYLGG